MHCPSCKIVSDKPPVLSRIELEPGLGAMGCPSCKGALIDQESYMEWRQHAAGARQPQQGEMVLAPSLEKRGAKFCPSCSSYLVKYDVGSNVDFSIDRCGKCACIWLDGNEWNQLKFRGLHTDLYRIFSVDWQSDVRREEHARALEDIWRVQFGDDYDEVVRIRKWIEGHPKAAEIYAFLSAGQRGRAITFRD